jgi:hypothetical protein
VVSAIKASGNATSLSLDSEVEYLIASGIDAKRAINRLGHEFRKLPFRHAAFVAWAVNGSWRTWLSVLYGFKYRIGKRLLIEDRNDKSECCD